MKLKQEQKAAKPKLHIIQDSSDKQIEACVTGPVSCRPGCYACCKQWVGVFWLEAVAMLEEAGRVGLPLNLAEVERQAIMSLTPGVTRERWFGTPCIFLTASGMCGAYKRRPMTCRSVLVASHPAQCGQADGRVLRYDTKEPTFDAFQLIRVEHYKKGLPDIVGPLPLFVSLAMKGKTPADLMEKTRKTGIVGLDEPGVANGPVRGSAPRPGAA